ncbi:MAG: hypothetical protein A2017_10715 [Lentisphaerae bacterium GWF2_44_16]|nr:MAG: hypothetical protein A2017_10715 [Lentisphaerae bacterium GWF2_44_16]
MKKRKKYFFTIVELLVVISIIVILAGILLPALKRAKDSVQRIACANKLKQIHIASEGYVQDHDGWMSLGRLSSSRNWYTEIGERLGKDRNFFMCPAEKVAFGLYTDGLFTYTHYGLNCEIVGAGVSGGVFYPPIGKISAITQPSIAIWFVDNGVKNTYASDDRAYVAFRHGGTSPSGLANLIYFDGHVRGVKYTEMAPGSSDFRKGF